MKDKALEHALMEYNRRPNNIDVNETVAWVYYNLGDYNKAVQYISAALKPIQRIRFIKPRRFNIL
jgi:hypothetical protein